jgi:predicted dehydrogenase
MIRAAIVGMGRWGQRLVDSVQGEGVRASELIRFTRGYTRTASKVREYSQRRGIGLADSYDALLQDKDVDAVVLATPHSGHVGEVLEAAAAGKPVFVEKPLALTLSDAIRARQACERAGVPLAVGMNRRFFPAVRELKRLVRGGELGTLLHVEGNFSGSFGLDYDASAWRARESEAPAGGLTLMGIHVLDTMIDLLGPIRSVSAISLRQVLKIELDDTSAAMLRFVSGQSGYLSTLTATARLYRLQVFGTKGWAHLLDHEVLDVGMVGRNVERRTWAPEDAERILMEAFAQAVAGKSAYPVSIDDVIHGIASQAAFVRSAKAEGRETTVEGTHA